MRPLKFRQMVKGRFHYWGFLESGEFTGPINLTDESQQFTGLSDRNGTEIYERDILERVNLAGETVRELVQWDRYQWTGIWNWKNAEVIGNSLQHPSLLKKE